MELPNIHFEDFPIDFKEINHTDFPDYSVNDKVIISPDSSGFIGKALITNIDIAEKNTVVVNAAVGQGKTTAIMEVAKDYYDNTDYLIFIASPYVSLVEQYFTKAIDKGIATDEVYRYEWIDDDPTKDAWSCRVQIVTVNCLLGNPGEESLISSKKKRKYIDYLSKKCEESNRKVIFIYDEIHDAIGNFKQRLIFNLWKWKDVIHKNFILSATYNEASKIVIEYLAELTDDKIQIIESERKVIKAKQSDLFLHFDTAIKYSNESSNLMSVIQELVNRGKRIDILSYSKQLAESICSTKDKGVGKILFDSFGELNNCTSGLKESSKKANRYNPDKDKCNVGTNFKSGVSIEKDNHAFIIVMPPLSVKGSKDTSGRLGIFADGVNSIIQALARQRIKGEIHIILPPPDKFNYTSLPISETKLKDKFIDFYKSLHNHKSKDYELVKYHSFNQQDSLLKDYYENVIYKNVEREESYVKTLKRDGKPSLLFPTYKDYKLSDGEKYFVKHHKFFGKDLSAFILYCAITNQFVNCTLKEVNSTPVLFFEEGNIQAGLEVFVRTYIGDEHCQFLRASLSDKYFYYYLQNEIFSQHKVLYKSKGKKEYIKITPSHKIFGQQLLAFTQRKLYPQNKEFNSLFSDTKVTDHEYSRGVYFQSCIAQALQLNSNLDNVPEKDKPLVQAYIDLNYFRQKMVNYIKTTGRDKRYLDNEPPVDFILPHERERYNKMVETLITKDPFISSGIFDFKVAFTRKNYSDKSREKAFYNYLKNDFFNGRSQKVDNKTVQGNPFLVKEVLNIPDSEMVFNLLTSDDFKMPEENLPLISLDNGIPHIEYSDGSTGNFNIK